MYPQSSRPMIANGTRLPAPGRARFGRTFALSLLVALTVATLPAAQTIFIEDFEQAFPGVNWTVGDDNAAGTPAFWGAVDASFGGEAPVNGSFKGYCAAVGHGGTTSAPTYQSEMHAFMRRTLDLTLVTSANLSFWYKAPTLESSVDLCSVFIDDTAIWTTGSATPVWTKVTLNLTPYIGTSRSLSFDFLTDSSSVREGFYLDDIIVATDVPPPNDTFASPRLFTGTAGALVDTTVNATKESEEPEHADEAGGRSTWYQWTPAASGTVIIDTFGSDFDTLLAVYTGDNLAELSVVAANNNFNSTNVQSRITFSATGGTVYRIAVDGAAGASGSLVLRWTQGALPDLVIAQPTTTPVPVERTLSPVLCEVVEGCALPGTRRYLRFNTETRNIGTGDLFVGDPTRNPLFHYAPCHGHYHFDAFADYRLTSNNVLVVAGNKIGFCLVDGQRWDPNAQFSRRYNCDYQGIQAGWVDTYRSDLPCQYIDVTDVAPGTYMLELEIDPDDFFIEQDESNNVTKLAVTITPRCLTIPTNDSFATPQRMMGEQVSTTGVNQCASKQSGEGNHAGSTGGHSLWYLWTAPSTEQAIITTEGTDFDTLLGVYLGNSVGGLSVVAQNNDISSSNRQSSVTFAAVEGMNYRIAVDGHAGAVGEIQLNINPPSNNHFENCQSIAGPGGATNGHTIGATAEVEEPAHGFPIGRRSVWYCWTAPADGPVEFYTDEANFETLLAVYTGHDLHDLVSVAFGVSSDSSALRRARFNASAGEEYGIAVDGSDGTSGEFRLNWGMPARLVAVRTPGGDVHLILHGAPGMEHHIQSSSHLDQWDALTTATIGEDGTTTVPLGPIDPDTHQFFRTTWP